MSSRGLLARLYELLGNEKTSLGQGFPRAVCARRERSVMYSSGAVALLVVVGLVLAFMFGRGGSSADETSDEDATDVDETTDAEAA